MSLACVMAGQYIAYRLNKTVRVLEEILLMLGIIENEIGFLNRPTRELIAKLAERTELSELVFLKKCAALSNENDSIAEIWSASVSQTEGLRKPCTDILLSFAESLGQSDTEGQISNCRYHSELTRERLSVARAQRDRCASLSCGLGFLSGIGLFIILI